VSELRKPGSLFNLTQLLWHRSEMNFELSRAKERKQLMSKDIHMRMNIGALKRFQMSLNMSRNKIVKSKWPLQKEC